MMSTSERPPTAPAPQPAAGGAPPPEPQPLLPDLRTLEPEELYVEFDPSSGVRKIRFSTTLLNAGEGPLELIGIPDPADGTIVARQRIVQADWTFVEREAGRFRYDGPHGHWHFEDLTVFELWSVGQGGRLDTVLATTGKATFCAVDEVPYLAHAGQSAYFGCDAGVQGLSAGWTDTYEAALPGQELDIGGLADGIYVIRTTVDPDNRLLETDDSNNDTLLVIELRDNVVRAID
jgi:hypothetical protein